MARTLRILPLSDIHLELTDASWRLPALPEFDVMVAAGDLVNGDVERAVEWISDLVGDRDAIYIMGNHESYGGDIDETLARAKAASAGTTVHVLQNSTVRLHGATFLGGTLFTDFRLLCSQHRSMAVAGEMMNDFRRVNVVGGSRRLTPIDTLARHVETRSFIARELAAPFDGPRIVISHHGVLREDVRPSMMNNGLLHPIAAAYTSDMNDFVERCGADLWITGHTHRSQDVTVGQTRVVSNPKGYGPRNGRGIDNAQFDPTMVIEIGRD